VVILLLFLIAVGVAAPLRHTPPAWRQSGVDPVLLIGVDDLALAQALRVWYRPVGTETWQQLPLRMREDGLWLATLPASSLGDGAVEYAILGPDGPRFASLERPWTVDVQPVLDPPEPPRSAPPTFRSTAALRGDWRSWGPEDWSWSGGASYTYRPGGPIRQFSLGFERVRGQVPGRRASAEIGYDQGYAAVEVELAPSFSFTPQVQLGAQDNFIGGGGLSARLGQVDGLHLEGWVHGLAGAYVSVGTQFNLLPLPRLPVGTFVEVTDGPVRSAWGSRLGLCTTLPIGKQGAFDLTLSSQGRRADVQGLGAGGTLSWSF
jgi:hypothetical protein